MTGPEAGLPSPRSRTGIAPLGKPHWFPLVAAVLGYSAAVDAVQRDAKQLAVDGCGPVVYVGDKVLAGETVLARKRAATEN